MSAADELTLAMVLVVSLICLPLLFLLVIILRRIRDRSMDRILKGMDDRKETVDDRDAWIESGRRLGQMDAHRGPSTRDGEGDY